MRICRCFQNSNLTQHIEHRKCFPHYHKMTRSACENTKSLHCDLYSFIFEAIRSKNVFPEYFYKMSILYFNHRWYASVYNACENLYWNALLFEISLSFFDWSSKLAVGNYHIGNFFCCLLFHFYHCLYFLGTLFLCQRQ